MNVPKSPAACCGDLYFGGHFQDHEADWVVAAVATGAIVGGTERAGETAVQRRPNEPTEAAFDVALPRERNGTWHELVVREPPAGGLGKRGREGLTVVLVEGIGMRDKRVEVKGRELLVGKREHVSVHSSSSLP